MTKMRKKLIVVAIIAIIILLGYYGFIRSNNANNTVTPHQSSNDTSDSSNIHIQINNLNNEKIQSFTENSNFTFTDPGTGSVISMRGILNQARNPGSTLYIDNQKIGSIQGQGILSTSFSPDNKYFAFRELEVCGATCTRFNIYVVDLVNKNISFAQAPLEGKDYTEAKSVPGHEINPYIESYVWDKDSIKVVFYFTSSEADGKIYRISPKQIWEYNVTTQKYSLVQTLSE